MPSLYDFLTNATNKIKNTGSSLYNRLTNNNAPLEAIQLDDNGQVDALKSLELQQNTAPLTPKERLFGRTLSIDTQQMNPQTGQGELTTITNRKPGLFGDFTAGYRENRSTPISLSNFGQDTTTGGRSKGWAYRFGEGMGSLARLADSPLGRSLLVGGIVGATGGNPLEMLSYGANTGAINQINRMRDRVYRDDLIAAAQQTIKNKEGFNDLTPEEQNYRLGEAANQINNYRGYLDNSTYDNMMQAQQMRDNAAYRQMYFDTQQRNQELEREWQRQQAEQARADRQAQFEYQKMNDAADRALRYEDLRDRRNQRNIDNYYRAREYEDNRSALSKQTEKQSGLQDIERQINNFTSTFENLPNKLESYTLGNLRTMTGTNTTAEANFNSQRSLLFNQIARTLGGEKGVLSDQDIQRIDNALPKLTDSYSQKMAKMKAVYDLLDIKKGQSITENDNAQRIGKYKVRVK